MCNGREVSLAGVLRGWASSQLPTNRVRNRKRERVQTITRHPHYSPPQPHIPRTVQSSIPALLSRLSTQPYPNPAKHTATTTPCQVTGFILIAFTPSSRPPITFCWAPPRTDFFQKAARAIDPPSLHSSFAVPQGLGLESYASTPPTKYDYLSTL